MNVDRKKRGVTLSIKAKETEEESAAVEDYAASTSEGATTFGDLIKEQLDNQNAN